MNRSLSLLLENLQRFDAPDCAEWHDSLTIELPQGFLRYRTMAQIPGKRLGNISVHLGYSYKSLSFSVKIAGSSDIKSAKIVEIPRSGKEDGNVNGSIKPYSIKDELILSLRDAQELFSYLQDNYACFTISVTTAVGELTQITPVED